MKITKKTAISTSEQCKAIRSSSKEYGSNHYHDWYSTFTDNTDEKDTIATITRLVLENLEKLGLFKNDHCALLDVGCGSGYLTKEITMILKEKCTKTSVFAMDLSKDFVRETTQKLLPIISDAQVIEGNIFEKGLKSFDGYESTSMMLIMVSHVAYYAADQQSLTRFVDSILGIMNENTMAIFIHEDHFSKVVSWRSKYNPGMNSNVPNLISDILSQRDISYQDILFPASINFPGTEGFSAIKEKHHINKIVAGTSYLTAISNFVKYPFRVAQENNYEITKNLVEFILHLNIDILSCNRELEGILEEIKDEVIKNNQRIIIWDRLQFVIKNKAQGTLQAIWGELFGKKGENTLNKIKENIFIKDKDGFNPLHTAIQENRSDIVGALIKDKTNLNSLSHDGFTPIFVASLRGNDDIIKHLKSSNAVIDFVNQGFICSLINANLNNVLESLEVTYDHATHCKDKGAKSLARTVVPLLYKAANLGYSNAHLILGKMYLNGYGVTHNTKKALKLYIESAQLGNVEAQYELGRMVAENISLTCDETYCNAVMRILIGTINVSLIPVWILYDALMRWWFVLLGGKLSCFDGDPPYIGDETLLSRFVWIFDGHIDIENFVPLDNWNIDIKNALHYISTTPRSRCNNLEVENAVKFLLKPEDVVKFLVSAARHPYKNEEIRLLLENLANKGSLDAKRELEIYKIEAQNCKLGDEKQTLTNSKFIRGSKIDDQTCKVERIYDQLEQLVQFAKEGDVKSLYPLIKIYCIDENQESKLKDVLNDLKPSPIWCWINQSTPWCHTDYYECLYGADSSISRDATETL